MRCNVLRIVNPEVEAGYMLIAENGEFKWVPSDVEWYDSWSRPTDDMTELFYSDDIIEPELIDVPREEAIAFVKMMKLMEA